MPGMKTHDLFGTLAAKENFPTQLLADIQLYPAAWHIGLQGPDLFFYSVSPWIAYPLNPGNVMHRFASGPFFARLLDARAMLPVAEQRIADAYICGFMGHYTLDCICHPYVYCRTKHLSHEGLDTYDFGMHVFLETDMDNACVTHYTGLAGIDYSVDKMFASTPEETRVITELLFRAIHTTYAHVEGAGEEQEKVRAAGRIDRRHIREAIATLPVTAKLLQDEKGRKKQLVRTLEQYFIGYAVISGMMTVPGFEKYPDPCNEKHHPWKNPWDPTEEVRTESVYELMDDAAKVLRRRVRQYVSAVNRCEAAREAAAAQAEAADAAFAAGGDVLSGSGLPKDLWDELLMDLGNASYSTGYPAENPNG